MAARIKSSQGVLIQLRLTGENSFDADEAWRDGIVGSETCPHCRNVYEHVRSINAKVTNRPRKTDIDIISPFCGRVRILSTRLIDVIGPQHIERVAGLGRISDVRGSEQVRHRTAVARRDSVVLRGSEPSTAGLCRACGELLFGAVGETYVVRSEIPPDPFFLSDGEVYCTDRFWRDRLYDARLNRVEAIEIPIRDEPEDGLPASIGAVKAWLRARQRFK